VYVFDLKSEWTRCLGHNLADGDIRLTTPYFNLSIYTSTIEAVPQAVHILALGLGQC